MAMTERDITEREWLIEQQRWRTDPDGIMRWALSLQLRNEKGAPMEWQDHRFMIEPMRDLHPLQVTRKCSQVGLSTVNIFRASFFAQVMERGIIYTLPTKDLISDFAATKIDPLLRNNPLLHPGQSDSVGKRVYGPGFVLYRGTFGEREQISITADLLIADEADRSNLAVLDGLESRLTFSQYKGQWRFSNPTRPNVGNDLLWQRSDQRMWHITCPHCGEIQPLDPWLNLDRKQRQFVCRRCHGSISNEARRAGRWIATKPEVAEAEKDGERYWHGYQMNQLMAPWITAAELVEAEETKTKEYVYNFLWGLPVIGEGISVDPSLIRQAQVWPIPEDLRPLQKFMGVDVGSGLHVVIGNEYGIIKATYLVDEPGQKDSRWEELARLMAREQINLCVIDNAPAEKQVEFQGKFRYKVLRCIYDYNDKRQDNWEQNREEGVIWAHRTRIIDECLDGYSTGAIKIYMEATSPWVAGSGKTGTISNCIPDHWGTLYVVGADGQDVNVVKKDRMGNVIRTWENAGPDHFAHANVYYWLARQAGRHLGLNTGGAFPAGGFPSKRPTRGSEDDDDDDAAVRPGFYR